MPTHAVRRPSRPARPDRSSVSSASPTPTRATAISSYPANSGTSIVVATYGWSPRTTVSTHGVAIQRRLPLTATPAAREWPKRDIVDPCGPAREAFAFSRRTAFLDPRGLPAGLHRRTHGEEPLRLVVAAAFTDNGWSAAARPMTLMRLNTLLPMTLPTETPIRPWRTATTDTAYYQARYGST